MSEIKKLSVAKSLDKKLKQVTYIVMVPDSVDLHGDFTSEEEVQKAMKSFNLSPKRTNLFHKVMTKSFDIIESYCAPVDFILGETEVKKGTWLMTFQVHDDSIWNAIESGEINGCSISGLASVQEVNDD
jgi:hypothetical protein